MCTRVSPTHEPSSWLPAARPSRMAGQSPHDLPDLGANVLEVGHDRLAPRLDVDEVEPVLQIETAAPSTAARPSALGFSERREPPVTARSGSLRVLHAPRQAGSNDRRWQAGRRDGRPGPAGRRRSPGVDRPGVSDQWHVRREGLPSMARTRDIRCCSRGPAARRPAREVPGWVARLADDPHEAVLRDSAGCPAMPDFGTDPVAGAFVVDMVAVRQG